MSERHAVEVDEAFAFHRFGDGDGPVVLTCEHASERIPEGFVLDARDERLVGTHWAFDIGAEAFALELGDRLGATLVTARFSRLLCDANREPGSPTMFREQAEALPVHTNVGADDAERERRLAALYRPFHAAVDRAVATTTSPVVLAVHSFTPLYEGERRSLELGVLFDREDELGAFVTQALAAEGFVVRENEPYSGKAGLIYVADTHATRYGRRALELEIRQDLAVDRAFRQRVIDCLARAFAALPPAISRSVA